MGRAYSSMTVEAREGRRGDGTPVDCYAIVRTRDPDDEFAAPQELTWDGGFEDIAGSDGSNWRGFRTRYEADCFVQGWNWGLAQAEARVVTYE